MTRETAIIIGAGPAGLTAARELLERTNVKPIVLEMSDQIGGLSQTVDYRGNRIDIGGHRFFSKSDRVMNWWLDRMPIEAVDSETGPACAWGARGEEEQPPPGPDPESEDRVMLLRSRRSRIYYQRTFFDYPIRLSLDTLAKLGLFRVWKIGWSYARSMLFPIRNVKSLEHFFINRFGRELYRTFFESYTEKVWGRPCSEISAEWGAQRIKGLSITKAIWHALKKPFASRDVTQKGTETSLIEQFLYPKYGPGQMWERVADEIVEMGGEVIRDREVRRLEVAGSTITAVEAVDTATGRSHVYQADYVFSTMPVQQLVRALSTDPPDDVRTISEGLVYRDFITVGLLVDELKVKENSPQGPGLIRDNWIYIQEADVRVGRMQVFNNWSPYMVADPSKVWIGMEYFANENDDLWNLPEEEIIALAGKELAKIGIIEPDTVLDATVIRMPKAYPAYFGAYDRFDELRAWLDEFENLLLIGRNGMHRYNNMDHSMLTAMVAVENVMEGRTDKSNIWAVNADQEYHESKAQRPTAEPARALEPAATPDNADGEDRVPASQPSGSADRE
ncbi:MAG: NAD(P)/FAD-dependent oxidoreductase [Planctomycetes bacterium]|nr:NAD(P)/FAD-dependent oxidoreductase [Planctomycetota bacterium]